MVDVSPGDSSRQGIRTLGRLRSSWGVHFTLTVPLCGLRNINGNGELPAEKCCRVTCDGLATGGTHNLFV